MTKDIYKQVFNSIDEVFCIIDVIFDDSGKPVDWCYLETNQQFVIQIGLSDAVGKLISDIDPGMEPYWFDFCGKVAISGLPARMEDQLKGLDKWFDVFAFKVGEPESRKVGVLFRDITERKRAEEALRESEEHYRHLFENMLNGFAYCQMLFDEQGRPDDFVYLNVNEAFGRLTGLTEITGKRVTQVIPRIKELNPELIEIYGRVASMGIPERFEIYFKPLSLYLSISVYCPRIGYFVAVFDDITERKRAEEALRESEERLRFIMGACQIGAWDMDIADHTTIRSPEHDRIYGYDEMLPEWTYEMFLEHVVPEDRARVDTVYQNAIKTQSNWSFEYRIRRPDGQVRWIWAAGNHRRDEDGVIRRVAGIVHDITERKQAEEVLRESEERQAFLLRLNDAIRNIDNPEEIQGITARMVGERMGVDRAGYGEVVWENGIECFCVKKDFHTPGMPDLYGKSYPVANYGPAVANTIHSGRTFAVEDIETDERITPEEREAYRAVNIQAVVNVPLIEDGRCVANFGVQQRGLRNWTPDELKLLEETVARIWMALQRARAEAALRESEARYKELVENANSAIIKMDIEGIISYFNEYAQSYFGYSREDAIGKNVRMLVSPTESISGRDLIEMADNILENPDEFVINTNENVKKNGERVWVSWRNKAIRNATGDIIGNLAIGQDITKRKLAEEALRESLRQNEISASMLRLSKVPFVSGYADGRIGVVNHAFEELVDYTEEELRTANWKDLTPPEWLEKEMELMAELDRTGIPIRYEKEYIRKDGSRVPIELFCHLVRDKDGKPEHYYSFITDLTERKKAEEALHESQAQLEEELKGAKLLQGISTALLYQEDDKELYEKIIDTASGIMHSQFASIQMLSPNGDDKGKLKLLAYRGFNQIAAEFWKYVDISSGSSCGEALRTGERILVSDVEKCGFLQGTEDQLIYLQTGIRATQTTPLYSRSGRPVGMISTHWSESHIPSESEWLLLDVLARQAADVIDRRQFEEALQESEKKANALVAELEIADQNKNQFISVLSHELRNPLAAISAGVQILDITQDINQIVKAKEIMRRQTNQLCKLVDDLLELTRISQNKIKLKKEYINLNEVLKSATDDIRPEYEKKGVKLGTTIQTRPIFLDADPVRITQAFGNILFNALKFTQADGVVWLTLKTERNNAVISIKDNGIGISPELLPHLFKPFTQADNTLDRISGGLGLGLSIVNGIVDLHEGNVSAYSEGLGKGSTFTIRLPIATGDKSMKEKQKSDTTKKTFDILIIEDNRDFAELLSSMFKLNGHEISIAADGMEGIEKAKKQIPDVIFCDIGLPGISGYEVARKIREDNDLKNVYLIALTGYAGNFDAELAKKSGFDKHLAKPVDMAILEKVLKDFD